MMRVFPGRTIIPFQQCCSLAIVLDNPLYRIIDQWSLEFHGHIGNDAGSCWNMALLNLCHWPGLVVDGRKNIPHVFTGVLFGKQLTFFSCNVVRLFFFLNLFSGRFWNVSLPFLLSKVGQKMTTRFLYFNLLVLSREWKSDSFMKNIEKHRHFHQFYSKSTLSLPAKHQ